MNRQKKSEFSKDVIENSTHGMGDDIWSNQPNENTPSSKGDEKTSTPYLNSLGVDLTSRAKNNELDSVIGRESEIEELLLILSKRKKANAMIIGEPGVGKTDLVNGLALAIQSGDVPSNLEGHRVVSLNTSSIVSDTKYRGEMEKRLTELIKEAADKDNKIILFIDEIHTIIGGGGASGSLDIANIFKPALSDGSIKVVGATTLNEYDKHIKTDAALERRFQVVKCEEPDDDLTFEIVSKVKVYYENYHNVEYSDDIIKRIINLTSRYMTTRHQPDKTIDTLDFIGASVTMIEKPEILVTIDEEIAEQEVVKSDNAKNQNYEASIIARDRIVELNNQKKEIIEKLNSEREKIKIKNEDVDKVVSKVTRIPLESVSTDDKKLLREMYSTISENLIGQDNALNTVVKAIQKAKVGLNNPKKPLLSALFIGSTGVGKTELAKQLAKYLFNDEDRMVRVDMSEYMLESDVTKITGASAGFVGHDNEPAFLQRVKHNPYSVVLLDEVEKAHPSVFNVFLQMLDDGHLTTSKGELVNFKNCVILMTSNVGVRELRTMGTGISLKKKTDEELNKSNESFLKKELKKKFSPEFLNRIDEVVYFNDLTTEDASKILDLELSKVFERYNNTESVHKIEVSETAKKYLLDNGYTAEFGARGLKRFVESKVVSLIVEIMIEDSVDDRAYVIDYNADADKLYYV